MSKICPDCRKTMTLLLTSFVCDHCDELNSKPHPPVAKELDDDATPVMPWEQEIDKFLKSFEVEDSVTNYRYSSLRWVANEYVLPVKEHVHRSELCRRMGVSESYMTDARYDRVLTIAGRKLKNLLQVPRWDQNESQGSQNRSTGQAVDRGNPSQPTDSSGHGEHRCSAGREELHQYLEKYLDGHIDIFDFTRMVCRHRAQSEGVSLGPHTLSIEMY